MSGLVNSESLSGSGPGEPLSKPAGTKESRSSPSFWMGEFDVAGVRELDSLIATGLGLPNQGNRMMNRTIHGRLALNLLIVPRLPPRCRECRNHPRLTAICSYHELGPGPWFSIGSPMTEAEFPGEKQFSAVPANPRGRGVGRHPCDCRDGILRWVTSGVTSGDLVDCFQSA